MATDWEAELASLLGDLVSVQDELFAYLAEKQRLLIEMDTVRLDALETTGADLMARLQHCHDRRSELLALSASESRPVPNLRTLARSLPAAERARVEPRVTAATKRARLLQSQSLANWVFVQRSLLHLSRLLEIIATGGRVEPTYGRDEPLRPGGSLVDQAA